MRIVKKVANVDMYQADNPKGEIGARSGTRPRSGSGMIATHRNRS